MSIHLQSHLESLTDPTNHDVSVGQLSFGPAYCEVEPGDKVTFTSTRKLQVTVTIADPEMFVPATATVVLASEESQTFTVRPGGSGAATYTFSAPLEIDSVARKSGLSSLTGGMTGTIKVGGAALTDIPTRAGRRRARPPQESNDKLQER